VTLLVEALNTPTWTDIVRAGTALVAGGAQCGLIYVGLRQMVRSSEERNRQLDAMEARQAEQSRALTEVLDRQAEQSRALTEVLTELIALRRADQD
jgi:hypothetical protein